MASRARTEAACLASIAADMAFNKSMLALIEAHQKRQQECFDRIDALNRKEHSND